LDPIEIAAASVIALVVLIYAGAHVAFVLALVSFVSISAMINIDFATKLVGLAAFETINNYVYGTVPLFVLMGLLISVSDVGRDTFEVANIFFRRVKGGLGIATVAANTVFAAIMGVSIASAAIFTKIAVPEMLRFGYKPRFAVGVVAGSSIIGMLIPPSLLLILFGILTETSIGSLFIAGILPGIALALAFSIAIILMARYFPRFIGDLVPITEGDVQKPETPTTLSVKILPIIVIVGVVFGGLYGGVFTPTEAGAVGAFGALILALIKRKLSWKILWKVLVETGHTTAAIGFLIISASMYARLLTLSRLPQVAVDWLSTWGLGLNGTLAIYVAVVLAMGTILDALSIMLILLPFVVPIMIGFDVNLIWFGIITIIAGEMGSITPPLGLVVYVVKSTLDDNRITLGDIFAGSFPFVVIMLLVLILVISVPWLALGLL
jgi:tripartite ATP-independent transporter DctM subunit